MRLCSLVVVAQAARKPEISFIICATFCHRNNVFDLKQAKHITLRALAVTASFSNLLAHPLTKFVCDHGSSGGSKPR